MTVVLSCSSIPDYRRIKAKSQRLIDERRARRNKLLPRDVQIPASKLQLDPIAARASIGGCVIRAGEIVKVLPR